MPNVRKRKFGKLTYYWYDRRSRIEHARNSAEWSRSKGFKVRITGNYRTGYDLWSNPKRN